MNLKRGYKQVRQLEKEEMKEYGEFFREMRLSIGLTQKEMAAEIGVYRYTVYRWENGYTIPQKDIYEIEEQYREVANKYKMATA